MMMTVMVYCRSDGRVGGGGVGGAVVGVGGVGGGVGVGGVGVGGGEGGGGGGERQPFQNSSPWQDFRSLDPSNRTQEGCRQICDNTPLVVREVK
jgi:hypothetical protein